MTITRILPRQIFNEYAPLMDAAREALPAFENFLHRLAKYYGCDYIVGPLKTLDDVKKKNKANAFQTEPCQPRDYCRGMLIVEDDQLDKIVRMGHELHPKNNPNIKGVSDRISEPLGTGFRALYIFPEMPNGHICEIIIMPRCMKNGYDLTHDMYEAWRQSLIDKGVSVDGYNMDDKEVALMKEIISTHECAISSAYARLTLDDPA